MSLENEDQGPHNAGPGNFVPVIKKPIISYSREFLLALSDLDVCKKLPSGFDESLLSEFEDASQSMPDGPRIPGSLPLQGFRRNEHGSSPPTRGNSGNYSRGNYGKWEARSSGRNDRDSDSQSDRDSDSGRRYGHESRRSWQTSEHDGLLGSGSFPKPSGFAGGTSAPKARTSEHHQLSKSNEPYHPPRPYKALPYARRDTDSFNDETFGSSEHASEDRAEDEKRRRASFEVMRKEQQKALQEKQKLNLEKHRAVGVSQPCKVLGTSKEERGLLRNNELEIPAATSMSSNDLEKSSFASSSPTTRPLVPPGFRNNIPEKSSGMKSLHHLSLAEVGKPENREGLLDTEANTFRNSTNDGLERCSLQDIGLVNGQPSERTQHAPLLNKGEHVTLYANLHVPIEKLRAEDDVHHASSHLGSHGALNGSEVRLKSELFEENAVSDSNRSHSTTDLEKIVGSTLSMNHASASLIEHRHSNPDDTRSLSSVHSSKFAQWFYEEEARTPDVISSAGPNDLLSLIVSGGKDRNRVSAAEHFPHDFSCKTLEQSSKITSEMPASHKVSDQIYTDNKEEATPNILTCEDLEQSMLSNYSTRITNVQPLVKSRSGTGATIEKPSANVDGQASLSLLSLLKKGTEQSCTTPVSGVDINLADRLLVCKEYDMGPPVNEPKGEERSKDIPDSGKTLTLETLFGTAFMKELQSVEAPISIQRGSNESAQLDAPVPHGSSFQFTNYGNHSPINKFGLQIPTQDYSGLAADYRQQTKLSEAEDWSKFDSSQIGITSSKQHAETVPKLHLHEENLISVGNHQNNWTTTFMPIGNPSRNIKLSSNAPTDITEKLATLGTVVRDERVTAGSENLAYTRRPFEQMSEISKQSLHVQQPPQFQPPQMIQGSPLYHHLNSQMKFLSPQSTFNSDSPANHQFSSNVPGPPFHQPNVRVAGFDVPSHHPMLHQMQMAGNHHPHTLPDFSRSGPVSHHGNQANSSIHERNQMQGYPFGPYQPNISSRGVPMPGLNVNSSGNPPEAFQKLIEMELRANSKQIHPFAPLEMGFQYR